MHGFIKITSGQNPEIAAGCIVGFFKGYDRPFLFLVRPYRFIDFGRLRFILN